MKSRNIALTGVLTALIAVSAFIRIPTPVMPLTLQVFVVVLAPMLAGLRVSFAAIALYIALGLIGFPIFSTGGGPAYLLQPSFGYLPGFLLSTLPNALLSRGGRYWQFLAGGFAAVITLHLIGGFGFWVNVNFIQGKPMSVITAYIVCVVPFLVPDFIKAAAASVIAWKIKPRLFY